MTIQAGRERRKTLGTSGVSNGKRSRNKTTGMFALTETLAGVTQARTARERKSPATAWGPGGAGFLELSQMRRKYAAAGS